MKFRLSVRKTKCTGCDVITLVENNKNTVSHLQCPICLGDLEVMENEIMVAEESCLVRNPQDLTSICIGCGIDLSKCICEESKDKNIPFKGYKGYKGYKFFNLD